MMLVAKSLGAAGTAPEVVRKRRCCKCNCGARGRAKQVPGSRSAESFIGTGLRHARAALSGVIRHGPDAHVARELRCARDAFDNAIWLCDCCEADQ